MYISDVRIYFFLSQIKIMKNVPRNLKYISNLVSMILVLMIKFSIVTAMYCHLYIVKQLKRMIYLWSVVLHAFNVIRSNAFDKLLHPWELVLTFLEKEYPQTYPLLFHFISNKEHYREHEPAFDIRNAGICPSRTISYKPFAVSIWNISFLKHRRKSGR